MKYIFDTNILIEIKNCNEKIAEQLERLVQPSDTVYITVFNVSEFYYGAVGKGDEAKRLASEFLHDFEVITITSDSAKMHAELSHKYDRKGIKIGEFDMLMVAVAVENEASILTMDKGFEKIEETKSVVLKKI